MLFGQFNIGLQPAGMQELVHSELINNNNGTYTLNIAHDPSGEDYLIIISSNYTTATGSTGTIHREYTVSYKGPTKAIPYFPATWYKYLAWGALIVISLVVGKYFVPEAGVVISVVASVFYTIGWFYEFGDAYMLLALSFCWVGSIALLFMKREKEGEA
jgi:hypothetical protein